MTGKRRRSAIGGEVDAALQDLEAIDEARGMTAEERQRLKKQLKRVDAHYDVPRALKDAITQLGAELGTSSSAVARVMLAHALRQYEDGKLDFHKVHKKPSVSPKYDYQIEDKEILAILSGERYLGPESGLGS